MKVPRKKKKKPRGKRNHVRGSRSMREASRREHRSGLPGVSASAEVDTEGESLDVAPAVRSISKLHLKNFKQFADTMIELPRLALLVGPNNCGKTSVLWAIKLFFHLMNHEVREQGGRVYFHNRYVTVSQFMPVPPQMEQELWLNKQQGKAIEIAAHFDDGTVFTVVLRAPFAQVHVTCKELPGPSESKKPKLKRRKSSLPARFTASRCAEYVNQKVAFIPGLVGVLPSEPYATPVRRAKLATEGRYSEIFRSSLMELSERDKDGLRRINNILRDNFLGTELLPASFQPDMDEYVNVRFRANDVDLDVVMAGSGLQQVTQVLSYIFLTRPSIILIDEPDAHLHPTVQAALGGVFRDIAAVLGAQVVISTHSYDLIDRFPVSQIVLLDGKRRHARPMKSDSALREALLRHGLVANSALVRLFTLRRCLVVEDENTDILERLCEVLDLAPFRANLVRRAKGVARFGAVKEVVERGISDY